MSGRPWTSAEVADGLGVRGPSGLTFTGISTDTRYPIPGTLFIALKGERFDAHEFLPQAKAQGAAAAVVRRGTPPVPGLPFIEVDDPLKALGRLARARRRMLSPGAPVVAVTGSSGKTSVKEMLRAALGARYRVHVTNANLNNLVGVPLTILDAPLGTEALVIEAGASEPGEIARLREIIEPTIAVITNVGYAHVAGFGSFEGVMREKLSLLDGVPVAVVGTDPPTLAAEARRRTRTIVAPPPSPIELDADGRARIRWEGAAVTLPVPGFHQADNAMLALAAAREAGVEPARAVPALAGVEIPGGRVRTFQAEGLTIIDDTYNANPASLRRALEYAAWMAGRAGRPLAVVVGTMLELGPESARLHAEAAREIAARHPSLIAAVGEFVPAFAALGRHAVTAADAEALGPALEAALRGDEIVLLKASRGVALERVLRHLT